MEGDPTSGGKNAVKHTDISAEILKRTKADQEMRAKSHSDDSIWDERVDQDNTDAMKSIVQEIGWPTVSKVGKEASHAAWLLVQHADHDPAFQQYCLDLMKAEPEGEVVRREIAFLEDRIRVNTNQPQVYGTQFEETRDTETRQTVTAYGPRAIEDPEGLDARRAAMGLEPFEEYWRSLTDRYHPHLLGKAGE